MKLRFADAGLGPEVHGLLIFSVAGRVFSPAAKAFRAKSDADDAVIPLVRPEGYPGVAWAQVLDVPGDEGVFLYLCDREGTPIRPAEYQIDPGFATYAASLSPVR